MPPYGPAPAPGSDAVASPTVFSGAVSLPDADRVSTAVMIDPVRGDALLRVPLDDRTQSLAIEVLPTGPESPMPERMSLLDETGQSLYAATGTPGQRVLSLNVPAPHDGPSHAFFVRVGTTPGRSVRTDGASLFGVSSAPVRPQSASGTVAADGTVKDFVLVVTRQSIARPSRAAAPWTPPETGPTLTPPPSDEGKRVTPRSPVTRGLDEGAPAPPTVLALMPVVTGPLPTRSAAPMGGIFATGLNPAPRVEVRDTTAVDLALGDLRGAEDAAGPAGAVAAVAVAAPDAEGPVVSLRAAGGFPLLGTALITQTAAARTPRSDGPRPALFARPAPAPASPPGQLATPSPALTAAASAARSTAAKQRRGSAWTVLSVAFAFAAGLALPAFTDPVTPGSGARSTVRRLLARTRRRDPVG